MTAPFAWNANGRFPMPMASCIRRWTASSVRIAAFNLFGVDLLSWESGQEARLDAPWQSHHHPPDDV
jgi:hypothetical protein